MNRAQEGIEKEIKEDENIIDHIIDPNRQLKDVIFGRCMSIVSNNSPPPTPLLFFFFILIRY